MVILASAQSNQFLSVMLQIQLNGQLVLLCHKLLHYVKEAL